jgi:hypothetical protein
MKQKQLSPIVRAMRRLLRGIWFLYLGLLLLVWLVGVVLVPLFRVLAVACLASLWLAPGIHELGHLIAGRLVGFRFHFVTVGPLKFAREGGRIRIKLMKGWSMLMGLAGTLPTDNRDLRGRMTIMLAGGPAASLLLTAISLALYFGLDYHRSSLSDLPLLEQLISALLLLCGLLSLGIILITVLPIRIGNLSTDGAKLLMLRTGGSEAERHCAMATLVEPYTRLRAVAAVLLSEGDHEAARQRASEGLAAIERSGDSHRAQVEADWLREILAWPATGLVKKGPPAGAVVAPMRVFHPACVFPPRRVE